LIFFDGFFDSPEAFDAGLEVGLLKCPASLPRSPGATPPDGPRARPLRLDEIAARSKSSRLEKKVVVPMTPLRPAENTSDAASGVARAPLEPFNGSFLAQDSLRHAYAHHVSASADFTSEDLSITKSNPIDPVLLMSVPTCRRSPIHAVFRPAMQLHSHTINSFSSAPDNFSAHAASKQLERRCPVGALSREEEQRSERKAVTVVACKSCDREFRAQQKNASW
jgi:hypothetical protein